MLVSLSPIPEVGGIDVPQQPNEEIKNNEKAYLADIYNTIIINNNKIDPKVAKYLSMIIEEESLASGWNPLYIANVIAMESAFKVNSINKNSGAKGLMQVMPMHYKGEEDYGLNIHKGVSILDYCYKVTKDCLLAYECFCAGNKYKEFYKSGKYVCDNRKIRKFKDKCRLE